MIPDAEPTHEPLDPSDYLNVARYWAHRYRGTGDYADLYQQACLGLLSARDTWVPEAGSQSTHVHFHVRRALWLLARSRRRQKAARNGEPVVSLDASDGSGRALHEYVEGSTLPLALLDLPRVIEAIQGLPARERRVLELRYALDGNGPAETKEIAEVMGMTLQGVRDAEHRAISRLRKRLR